VRRLVAAGEGETVGPPPEAPAEPSPARAPSDKSGLLDALHDLETAKARLDGLLKG
jgi:hypothetical protein